MSVLFWDAVGAPFDGDTPKTTGLGGSEMAQIQLAEALAERGHKVRVLVGRDTCFEPRTINGVTYGHSDLSDVKTVIASRMTPVPEGLADKQIIVSLTDMGPHKVAKCEYLVGVSRWQVRRFQYDTGKVRVIPPIVERGDTTRPEVPGRFVYCSARAKGLDSTLEAWKNIRQYLPENAHLRVTTAGWDLPLEGSVEAAGAKWLGVLTPTQIREEIASAVGLFFVNTYQETFCAVAAIAEASRTRPCIYCPNGAGGLAESINTPVCKTPQEFAKTVLDTAKGRATLFPAKNYSKNKVAQAWEKLLED